MTVSQGTLRKPSKKRSGIGGGRGTTWVLGGKSKDVSKEGAVNWCRKRTQKYFQIAGPPRRGSTAVR